MLEDGELVLGTIGGVILFSQKNKDGEMELGTLGNVCVCDN